MNHKKFSLFCCIFLAVFLSCDSGEDLYLKLHFQRHRIGEIETKIKDIEQRFSLIELRVFGDTLFYDVPINDSTFMRLQASRSGTTSTPTRTPSYPGSLCDTLYLKVSKVIPEWWYEAQVDSVWTVCGKTTFQYEGKTITVTVD